MDKDGKYTVKNIFFNFVIDEENVWGRMGVHLEKIICQYISSDI